MVRRGERGDASNFGNLGFASCCTSAMPSPFSNHFYLLKKPSEYGNAAEISGAQCQVLFSLFLSSILDAFPSTEVLNF